MAHLNPVPEGAGIKPREFYRIDRRAICEAIRVSRRLPQNEQDINYGEVNLYNVPMQWISDIEPKPEGHRPISHVTLRTSHIGKLAVRLLGFKPAYYKGRKVKSSSQRLEVNCIRCGQWVPFSRLNQHMYKPNGEYSVSCASQTYKPLAVKRARKEV